MTAVLASDLVAITKDTWTQDYLSSQFYDKYPFLDDLERTSKYTIGNKARVPLHSGRSGGTTVLGPAGGTLNANTGQLVAEADYTLAYNWDSIGIQFGALNQVAGGNLSIVESLDLQIKGKVNDQRKDIVRQLIGNGDGRIARCTTTSGSTTILLDPPTTLGAYGNDALVRGWIRPGQVLDVGTAANPVLRSGAGTPITVVSVSTSATAPSFVSSASLTTANTDFCSIAQARSGSTTVESTGLRAVAGSASAVVGGLDPATATYWQPAIVDTATTAMTIDLPLTLQQNVFQQVGQFPSKVLTGIKQITRLYTILQNQIRFPGDLVKTGNAMQTQWSGMEISALPDVPDCEWYMYTPEDLLIVTGKYGTATWMSDVMGTNQGLQYVQGGTSFVDSIAYALGLGVRRRNSHAAAIGLVAA